jgi:cobalt/nickel transport system ATP-binding protein
VSAALRTEGLAVGWPGAEPVLQGIDLALRDGEKLGLVGPNGAGKSTLFLTLAGVLAPLAGRILLGGEPRLPGTFRPDVALLFQQAEDQLFCPTLAEDVAYGARNLGLSGAALEGRVGAALAACDLAGLGHRPVHHLSGGEKRRAAIAGALVMAPRLMLLDEPSAALDLRNRRKLIALLAAREEAMIVASHDLELILELCPRVLLIDAGGIRADGPARAVLGDAALMQRHGQDVPHSLVPHDPPRHRHPPG